MKRSIITAILVLSCSLLSAAVWFVPDSSTATIQAAIDTAASGDTVFVKGAFQNVGPVEIVDKQISLLSKNYINNPGAYNIASGAALFDTLNTEYLLTIRNADNTVIKGFFLDSSDVGTGGGVVIDNSDNVIIRALYFNNNHLSIRNSTVKDTNTIHYNLDSSAADLISLNNSYLYMHNSIWKNNNVNSLLSLSNSSEIHAQNLASYKNNCTSNLYDINSSFAYFDFITTYFNSSLTADWQFNNSYVTITSSVLENNPPYDIGQCEINYTALPGPYPGNGNMFDDPLIDPNNTKPILLATSPCISAANPDTSGIPHLDLNGKQRPNPQWAPPDMGAFESSRYMMLHDSSVFWITLEGDDIWGNGSPEYPFAGLQAAIDYAEDNDTILIKPGTYYGQATIDEKSLFISSEYAIGMDSTYRDSVILIPDTSIYSPVFIARKADSLRLSGLSLKNGSGRFYYKNYTLGGALYIEESNVYLNDLLFENNHAEYSGGAIFASDSYLEMNNLDFVNDSAYFGGAFSLVSTIANISNVNFSGNIASSGGAIYAENNSKLVGFYLNFSANKASNTEYYSPLNKPSAISQYGGAIYATNSEFRLQNTLFSENSAVNKGPVIALRGGKLSLLQSTLTANVSDDQNNGMIYLKDQSQRAVFANNIMWNDDEYELELIKSIVDMSNSCLQNNQTSILSDSLSVFNSSTIYTQDPVFDTDFVLDASSPYINSGLSKLTQGSYYLFNYDEDEYEGSAPGLGYTGASPLVSFILEEYEVSVDKPIESFEILRAYPNPFNPTTTLEFILENDAQTRLDLYDIRGRHINTLLQDFVFAGKYTYTLNASDLSSGIYICRLSQNGRALSNQKILLVK